jgi:hypothetical protein
MSMPGIDGPAMGVTKLDTTVSVPPIALGEKGWRYGSRTLETG